MNIQWNKRLLAFTLLLSVGSVIGAVTYNHSIQQRKGVNQSPLVKEPPVVISKIEGLQIGDVRLVNQGTTQAAIDIDVTNNRDSAVMSLDFIWRHQRDSGGMAIDGLLDEDSPRIIIPPHTLKTFTWSLSEILQGETVFLAAAIFADGKEEGDKRSLDGIHKTRTQRPLKRKGQSSGGQQ